MNVLSLFDGMACGRVALERAGIPVDLYISSEVDKYAMQIARKNWPDVQHIGDVTRVVGAVLPKIDLLIGGSPCQGFSFAGKQLNFDDPRSALFFEFVRLLRECKPRWFLLENVRMKKEFQAVITAALGVEPVLINSALVSAQNRKRLYWTNIPGVTQPEDRGVMLKDVLECAGGGVPGRVVDRAYNENGKRVDHKQSVKGITSQIFELNANPGKTNCLSTVQNDNVVLLDRHSSQDGIKCVGGVRGRRRGDGKNLSRNIRQGNRVFSPDGKAPTLNAKSGNASGGSLCITTSATGWRKLTPLECERLQTLPDGYTEGVSNTQRYRMIGNGWTIEVIKHIFEGIPT